MPVNLIPPAAAQLLPVAGVFLGVTEAGIKRENRKDLLVMQLSEGARVAGVFTRNRFCAAPVTVAREHLADTHEPRLICLLLSQRLENLDKK